MEEKEIKNDNSIENIENEDSNKTDKKSKKKSKNNEVQILKEQIKELEDKNAELQDKYLRLVAEYDNFRKRTAKEKTELKDIVKASLLLDFLPVVDDMDRAMAHLSNVTDVEATIEGIKLIYNKFNGFLKSQGLIEIEAKDKDFDTDLHEAVTKFPVDEEKKGKVIDVLTKGYTLNDKVVRFAKVVVGE